MDELKDLAESILYDAFGTDFDYTDREQMQWIVDNQHGGATNAWAAEVLVRRMEKAT